MKKLLLIKIKLWIILSVIVPLSAILVISTLLGGNYVITKKYEASKQKYLNDILELSSKNNQYKEQYQDVLAIKDKYRTSIKEIVEMLYNKDTHLAIGGAPNKTIENTDEAVLLQIRNTVAIMEDDQKLLNEVKHYLSARREFLDSFPFTWPVKGGGVPRITSGYGFRKSLDGGDELHFHAGIDIAGNRSDPIIATSDGIVYQVWDDHELLGKLVIIKHKYEFTTVYGHLNLISVVVGQKVIRGDTIGTMGDSGISFGVHLHYEIRQKNISIDPMVILGTNF